MVNYLSKRNRHAESTKPLSPKNKCYLDYGMDITVRQC